MCTVGYMQLFLTKTYKLMNKYCKNEGIELKNVIKISSKQPKKAGDRIQVHLSSQQEYWTVYASFFPFNYPLFFLYGGFWITFFTFWELKQLRCFFQQHEQLGVIHFQDISVIFGVRPHCPKVKCKYH